MEESSDEQGGSQVHQDGGQVGFDQLVRYGCLIGLSHQIGHSGRGSPGQEVGSVHQIRRGAVRLVMVASRTSGSSVGQVFNCTCCPE